MFIRRFFGHVRRHSVAYVALFFALSGAAVASTNYITKSEAITNGDLAGSTYGDPLIAAGKVTNKELAHPSVSVNAGTGLTGGGSIALGGSGTLSLASGYQLPQNCSSDQVATSNGSGSWVCKSANVTQMMGGSIGTINATAGDQYLAPIGLSTPDTTSSNVEVGTSAVASAGGNLSVQLSTPPGTGATWGFELVSSSSGVVSACTIANLATTCTKAGPGQTIDAGATVWLHAFVSTGTPAAARVTFGWTATTNS